MRSRSKVVLGIGLGASWLAMGLAVSACGGDDAGTYTIIQNDGGGTIVQLSDGGSAVAGKLLISSAATPANGACPAGGTTISVGYDTNANGTLDPSEVTSSQEVCNAVASDGGSGGSAQILTTITHSTGDDMCANGGTIVKSGADTNGNGILDPGEVTSTNEICGGGFSNVLSVTTALPVGSTTCPLGGTETQSGPDNGANGGTAGDGVLQTGEITSTVNVCTQPSNASNYFVQSFAPPAPVANQQSYAINLNGGTSATADAGGGGGSIDIEKPGTLGGHIKFFRTGQADASFTLPAYTPSYGTGQVLDVNASNSPVVVTEQTPTSATQGQYYFDTSNGYQLEYFQDATSDANKAIVVTGVHVEAGYLLTLPSNAQRTDTITVSNDIVVEGAVTAAPNGSNGSDIILVSNNGAFVGGAPIVGTANTGTIDASGAVGASNGRGGTGGTIYIVAANGIYNRATITSNGGNGGASSGTNGGAQYGGNGGFVLLNVTGGNVAGLYNEGAISTNGGNGTVTATGTGTVSNLGGAGGPAGGMTLLVNYGGLYNSGALNSLGGNGAGTAGGGGGAGTNGNSVTLQQSNGGGPLLNSGSIDVSGGNVDATCTGNSCSGSSAGGFINFYPVGGNFVSSGSLTASAGTVGGGSGGNTAGTIKVEVDNGQTSVGGALSFGNVILSGNITANGGAPVASGNGGFGGQLNIEYDPSAPSTFAGQEIQFLGYTTINLNGGSAGASPGNGGSISLQNEDTDANLDSTGAVINYADISLTGGAGTTSTSAYGGNGGALVFEVEGSDSPNDDDDAQVVINAGILDISGGAGVTRGGGVGRVVMVSPDGVINTALIKAIGGATSAVSGVAGSAANRGEVIYVHTDKVLTNSGLLDVEAGTAEVPAGATGTPTATGGSFANNYIGLYAGTGITNSGDITFTGGGSVGVAGGAGGSIYFTNGGTFTNTGIFTVTGGAGLTAGVTGSVVLNNQVIQ